VQDLTDLAAAAARTNDPRVVSALSERFPRGRLHLPLASLDGVKNRPETALELGSRLPLHRLRLDDGLLAIPLFTSLELCRECAKKLSWRTDGKAVKTLPVPGSIALAYLKDLLLAPDVDRAIVNPLSEGALHLARTEVEAIASGQKLRTLWLYSRSGGLNRQVEIAGGSLLSAILGAAGRAVAGGAKPGVETAPSIEDLPDGPFSGLAAELYPLLLPEADRGLEVVLTRSRGGIRIESTPVIDAERLAQAKAIAERNMADSPEGTRVSLRVDGASIVLASSRQAAPPAPPVRGEPGLGYIPLEPEAPEE
jgi:hypothetical protein